MVLRLSLVLSQNGLLEPKALHLIDRAIDVLTGARQRVEAPGAEAICARQWMKGSAEHSVERRRDAFNASSGGRLRGRPLFFVAACALTTAVAASAAD